MMFSTDFCKLGAVLNFSGLALHQCSYLFAALCSSNTFGTKRRRNKTFGALVLQMIFVVFFMELSEAGFLKITASKY